MRAAAAGLFVALIVVSHGAASAQGRLLIQPSHLLAVVPATPAAPVVAVAPITLDDPDSIEHLRHVSDLIAERLQPIEQRLRDDDRLRRAGAIVGISAIALGAMRGTKPLTFAGTQALRFGLNKQLTAIQQRSGLVVEPSIGHRSISVSVSRTFE